MRGITDANLHYQGSITIDEELMELADIVPYERVQVVNVNNGARLETYVMPGERGKGEICLNGAAARLGAAGRYRHHHLLRHRERGRGQRIRPPHRARGRA